MAPSLSLSLLQTPTQPQPKLLDGFVTRECLRAWACNDRRWQEGGLQEEVRVAATGRREGDDEQPVRATSGLEFEQCNSRSTDAAPMCPQEGTLPEAQTNTALEAVGSRGSFG